jgi:nucleoid-associated protein YgaU
MGQCLRGKMTEAGLIPAAPATAVAEAETPAEPETVATVEEAVTPEPELDVTPPAAPAAEAEAEPETDEVIAATFGLLRAEPDGSVVIAGSGTPGTEVEIFANGEPLGTAEVEQSGDWVFVPDQPLAPGGLEITLGEEGKVGTAEDAFIVVIDEDRTTEPLVVASTPGEASEVLQGLTAPVAVAEAATPEVTEPEPAASTASPETAAEPAAEPQMDVATLPEPATPPVAAEPTAEEAAPETPAAAPVAEPPAPTTEPPLAEAPTPPPADSATPPVEAADAETDVPATAPAEQPAEPAPAPAPAPEPAIAAAPPTIDAIEIEEDRTFFAGAGPEGGTIRLYVDDEFVADSTVEDGRWLVEAGPVLDQPNQRVRADLLGSDSAEVAARAEVDFVVDLPEDTVDIAQAETPAPAAEPPASEPASTPAPATGAEPVPIVEPEQPQPAEPVAEPAPPEPAPAETTTAAEPAAPDEPAPVAEPAPAADAPETDEPEVPTLVAVSLGDPEAQRFASGKAIIRRGDNLWTIARRVYGEGIRYTTIYDANTGQIRDPNRIYPGQVFALPQDAASQ